MFWGWGGVGHQAGLEVRQRERRSGRTSRVAAAAAASQTMTGGSDTEGKLKGR